MSAVEQVAQTELAVDQEVRVTGGPQKWMRILVNRTGTIGDVKQNPNVTAYRVDGLPSGPVWLGSGYLEAAKEEERKVVS